MGNQRTILVSSSIILLPYCLEIETATEPEVCTLGQAKANELSRPACVDTNHYA